MLSPSNPGADEFEYIQDILDRFSSGKPRPTSEVIEDY
jgi:hypothetical protein